MHYRPAPSSPGVRTQLHSRESHAPLKPQSLSSKHCLEKNTVTLSTSCSPVLGSERFSSCGNLMPHSQPLSLSLPFVSPWDPFPPLYSIIVFHSPNLLPHTSHLPSCLPPIVEILFPVHRSISWVFQVIWPQYSCIRGKKKAQGPLLLHHLNSSKGKVS